MTPRQANALTAVGLAGLLATVALTAPRWAALLRTATPATPLEGEDSTDEATPAPPELARQGAGRRINVRLYFEAPDREGLLPEEREVAFSPDLAQQVRTVLEELAKGSTTGLLPTLPAGTRVLEVFVQARGVAYVDLSSEASSGLPGGSKAELLTVYSVVNTIVTNFPTVSRVRILVNDQPVASLGGHVDVSRPLPPDMTLVALPTPVPSPGATDASPSPAP
ncbi:MAG TPA: GerMN domain-containing protein [Vicinamibacteria bacterium]|nr:GerMN domain-containing protein [Vicinamibacteria bacterium]